MEISRMVYPYKIKLRDDGIIEIRQPDEAWQRGEMEEDACVFLDQIQLIQFQKDIASLIESLSVT
jgi:hypothetical protein